MAHRAYRGPTQKSAMAMCRKQLWLMIFALFAMWLLLICLNYSSMIDSIASLARFYVYSVNHQPPLSLDPLPVVATTVVAENSSFSEDGDGGETREEEKVGMDLDVDEKIVNETVNGVVVSEIEIPKDPIPRKKPRKKGRFRRKRLSRNSQRVEPNFNFDSNLDFGLAEEGSQIQVLSPPPPLLPPPPPPPPKRECKVEVKSDPESCKGRYVFMHTIPRKFNVDLLRDCKALDLWMDMCQYVRNLGLGLELPESDRKVFTGSGWYATNQFLLEVIFHNRMKQYDCLTNDSSQAAAIFVPFYAGLDVARHLWNTDSGVRDSGGFELVKWLRHKPEWNRWWGRDHFFIGGRITWDFRRSANKKDPDWGTKLLYLPETKNMTALVIESSPWNNNDFGIPYPTYFHPANDEQILDRQNQMKTIQRKYLFSFAGAPRPNRPDSIRNQIINQCQDSKKCMLIHCHNWANKCHKPAELMKMFQASVFCLQPPGDSYTRRSTFDSILAGCIPVFFHPGSAYVQYLWHFPREYTKYSVFIPMYEIRDGKVSIERTLDSIPKEKVLEMKEYVINLIPKIVYADPRCRLETFNDAFDVAIKGVVERVKKIKEDIREGREESFNYDERQAWKYRWLGKLVQHEWDPYFSGTYHTRNFTNF